MNNPPSIPGFKPDDSLSKLQTSRIFVYNTLAELVVYGYSNEEIAKLYDQAGYHVSTRELNQLIDYYNNSSNTIFDIADVPANRPIPEHVMDTFSTPHNTNYRYIGEFVTYDEETGERKEWRFIYDSDYLLTPDIAAQLMAKEWETEYPVSPATFVSSIKITNAFRSI